MIQASSTAVVYIRSTGTLFPFEDSRPRPKPPSLWPRMESSTDTTRSESWGQCLLGKRTNTSTSTSTSVSSSAPHIARPPNSRWWYVQQKGLAPLLPSHEAAVPLQATPSPLRKHGICVSLDETKHVDAPTRPRGHVCIVICQRHAT